MARALVTACTAVAAAAASIASAMGPTDPFGPPARTATEAEPKSAVGASAPFGLAGLRLGHAAAALIDGEWIALGRPVRGAVLAEVRFDGVTLRHVDGRVERIELHAPAPTTAASAPSLTSRPAAALGPT